MTEKETILFTDELSKLEKLKYYMDYFINNLVTKHGENRNVLFDPLSFEQFCDKAKGVEFVNIVCDDWEERGFASKEWVSLKSGYLYHRVYHKLKVH